MSIYCLAFAHLVEIPVTLPDELPVTLPVEHPVTLPVERPVTLPVELPVTLPAALPVLVVLELIDRLISGKGVPGFCLHLVHRVSYL